MSFLMKAVAWAQAWAGLGLFRVEGLGSRFSKPELSKAQPSPGLSGQAGPTHHYRLSEYINWGLAMLCWIQTSSCERNWLGILWRHPLIELHNLELLYFQILETCKNKWTRKTWKNINGYAYYLVPFITSFSFYEKFPSNHLLLSYVNFIFKAHIFYPL